MLICLLATLPKKGRMHLFEESLVIPSKKAKPTHIRVEFVMSEVLNCAVVDEGPVVVSTDIIQFVIHSI